MKATPETLSWLTSVPASDQNFKEALKKSNLATCEEALKHVTGKGTRAAIEARIKKLFRAEMEAGGAKLISPRPAAQTAHPQASSEHAASPGTLKRGVKTLTLGDLDVLPATPVAARGLKEMTLPELEAADRGLRAMPERLEKMSGICAVLNGLVLAEIKARLEHKQFTPWLKAHYGKTDRTARRYMQIAAAFSQNGHSVRFEPQQLTLALLDDSQAGALDLQHPVVQAVEKWADGRSFRQLIEDECSDGRESNPGGFRPNAQHLHAWLKAEYPEHPEYLLQDVFSELPPEVQKRFKAEGERYWERLTKEEKDEIEREEEATDWLGRAPTFIATAMDRALEDFGSKEQLTTLYTLLGDYRAQIHRKLTRRETAGGRKQLGSGK